MQTMPADIGLDRGQAFSVATVLVLGAGLALYQLTSLVLGPAGSRQLQLSLSIPAVETHDLSDPPAASSGVIGSLVRLVSVTSRPTVAAGHPSIGRPAGQQGTAPVTPTPVVAPPVVPTLPPIAPTSGITTGHQPVGKLPPPPQRDDAGDDETD